MRKSLASIAAIGAMIAATPLFAGPVSAENAQIKYDDLNLSSPAGQRALERRIAKAAREICGTDQQRTGTRFNSQSAKKCVENAKKQATRQMAIVTSEQQLGG